jgi:uncharacterized protein YbcI
MSNEGAIRDGELAARISKTVVRALSRTTGRGPTKTKTTLGANGVFVVLQDTLTRGEQTLTDAGQEEAVLDLRHRWQMVMKQDVSREIEELTGRKVIGFMSDNHIDPDLAVEVFVLEPVPSADAP